MKSILFLLSATVCFAIGCQKEDVPIYYPGSMIYGSAEAKKNGKDWLASSGAQHYDTIPSLFGMGMETVSEEGFPREDISFNKIPKSVGKYKVSGPYNNVFDGFVGSSYHTLEDDGDALEDTYVLNEDAIDNYLEITLIDTVANIVQGKFTVTYDIATSGGKRNPNNPDRVKFSDGSFDIEFFK